MARLCLQFFHRENLNIAVFLGLEVFVTVYQILLPTETEMIIYLIITIWLPT